MNVHILSQHFEDVSEGWWSILANLHFVCSKVSEWTKLVNGCSNSCDARGSFSSGPIENKAMCKLGLNASSLSPWAVELGSNKCALG